MPYKNVKQLLVDATKLPVAIEAMLPEGAPKISTMLADTAGRIPVVPDFPMEIPDLPAPPEIPAMPVLPGAPAGLRRYATAVTVTPVTARSLGPTVTPLVQAYTQPIEGVVGTVTSRRGM